MQQGGIETRFLGLAWDEPTALKNPELWLLVSGLWLMVTGWLQVDSGIVMASGSP
jgi:hypothetical protein